jgi:hypothetical protein
MKKFLSLIFILSLSATLLAQDGTVKQEFKKAGKEIKTAAKTTGKSIKKAGRQTGHAFRSGARAIRRTTKKASGEIKKEFK